MSGEHTTCRNCGAALTGNFCAVCGQKEASLNPTLRDLLHELWHELFHIDGKLIPSMRLLLTAPGTLTLEHYAGRRARYISPMRLYLVFSILYFAVAALTPANPNFRVTVGGNQTSGWNSEPRQSDPEELRKLGFESQEELQKSVSATVQTWMPRLMFLLVPLFAALLGLSVRSLRWNYPRHVHFALHLHATWFLLLAISCAARLAPWPWFTQIISAIVAVSIIVYFILALRRTYSLALGGAVWRTVTVGGVYGVLLVITLFVAVIPIVTNKP